MVVIGLDGVSKNSRHVRQDSLHVGDRSVELALVDAAKRKLTVRVGSVRRRLEGYPHLVGIEQAKGPRVVCDRRYLVAGCSGSWMMFNQCVDAKLGKTSLLFVRPAGPMLSEEKDENLIFVESESATDPRMPSTPWKPPSANWATPIVWLVIASPPSATVSLYSRPAEISVLSQRRQFQS